MREKSLLWQAAILLCLLLLAAGSGLRAEQPVAADATTPAVVSITQFTHDGLAKTNLVSDDSNLYVTEWPTGRHVVARFSLSGAARTVLPSSFLNIQALDVSPDRHALLVSPMQGGGDSEFWSFPVSAGSPHKIGDVAGRDASWSADGQKLVFSKGSGLYLANADGAGARQILTADGSVFAPHFSMDGKRIRYSVTNIALNGTTLWETGSDGSTPHALLGAWQYASSACCGNWTVDGRYYIFQVTQNSPTTVTSLWALPDTEAASAPIQLTSGPMSFGNASIAPDGKRLWAIGVQPAGQAVKYNAATKDFVALLSGISATDLDFSADGRWVAYVAVPDATLWRCRADGRDRLQLTSSPERTALPRWSPDGKQIAYVSMQPGKPLKISLMPRDGGKATDVLPENRGQIDANWSPDGSSLMFGSVHGDADLSIRVVNLKTHVVTAVPRSEGLFSPRWSPDGRYVAALSPDFTRVMLFDYKTGKWSTWLTEPAGAVNYPVWSADSQFLYFDDLVTDEESIRSVRVGENRTQRVFKLEGIERYPGPWGLWSGRTPDGSWMFVRDRSTQEVYELSLRLP
ncbi:MAG TPA: hypothetical protein VMG31_16580 [Verrucomicrobiae bacterium]|nr:hypothetical protein [Verrucomicrobiae bacterium]